MEGNPAVAEEWRLKPGAPRKVSAFLGRAEGKWELGKGSAFLAKLTFFWSLFFLTCFLTKGVIFYFFKTFTFFSVSAKQEGP